ncbi:MAG: hypothetical protein R8K20_07670 [Gallionellaceae bacterium]
MANLGNYGCAGGMRCKTPGGAAWSFPASDWQRGSAPTSAARMFKLPMDSPIHSRSDEATGLGTQRGIVKQRRYAGRRKRFKRLPHLVGV